MEYEIDTGALAQVRDAMQRAPQIVIAELEAAVTEADALLQREVQDRTPIGAHGLLRESIFHREEVSDSGVSGLVASPLIYAEPVELGTRPHFPPLQPLIDWVMHSPHFGISNEKIARGIAFLIARKISRVGTKGQHMFGITFQAQEGQVQAIFERAVGRIATRLAGGAA